MSTESSVDLIVISSLNCFWMFFCCMPPYELVASNFAVLILQVSQYWISLIETRFIFPLHPGHCISFRFDFMLSTSVLHLMSGQAYFPIVLVFVGPLHFGQMCSDISSPCSFSFSLDDNFRISSFIGVRIFLKRYWAIARGHSGNWSFVASLLNVLGNALKGTIMWKPFPPENLMPMLWMPCFSNCLIRSFAAIFP